MSVAPAVPEEKHEPTVVDGVLMRSSVSSMQKADSTAGGCTRAWRYKYVEHIADNEPPGWGQMRGTAGHKRIEIYLKGEGDTLDPLEKLGVTRGLIPPPGTDMLIEEHFGKPTPLFALDTPLTGYMDLVRPPVWLEGHHTLRVTDWKFKSSIAQSGTSNEAIIDPTTEAGIQMLGYGEWARVAMARLVNLWGQAFTHVRLAHVTFQTGGKGKTLPYDVAETFSIISLAEIQKRWDTVSRRIVPKMKQAAGAAHPHDVPPNTTVCNKYHRQCPYLPQCQDRMSRMKLALRKAAEARAVTPTKKEDADMSRLNVGTLQSPPIPVVPIPLPPPPGVAVVQRKLVLPPTPTNPQTVPAGTMVLAKDAIQEHYYLVDGVPCRFIVNVAIAGKSMGSYVRMDSTGNPVLVELTKQIMVIDPPASVVQAPADLGPHADALPIVVPPDAPSSNPALAALPPPADAPASVVARAVADGVIKPAAPAPVATTLAPAAAVAPARRGRPPKVAPAEVKAPGEAPATSPVPSMPAAAPNAVQVAAVKAPVKTADVHLYIDCTPIGVTTLTLHVFVDAIQDAINQHLPEADRYEDFRTADDKTFGFGKWSGYFSGAAKELFFEGKLSSGHYVVSGLGDERESVVAKTLTGLLPAGNVTVGR